MIYPPNSDILKGINFGRASEMLQDCIRNSPYLLALNIANILLHNQNKCYSEV